MSRSVSTEETNAVNVKFQALKLIWFYFPCTIASLTIIKATLKDRIIIESHFCFDKTYKQYIR